MFTVNDIRIIITIWNVYDSGRHRGRMVSCYVFPFFLHNVRSNSISPDLPHPHPHPHPPQYCTTSLSIQLNACTFYTLRWRHNGRDNVFNHQPPGLLNRLFRHRSKKTSKLRVTGLCVAQMASNAENVSIWWRHHDNQPFPSSLRGTAARYRHITHLYSVWPQSFSSHMFIQCCHRRSLIFYSLWPPSFFPHICI